MGFVAHILEQTKRGCVPAETQRLLGVRAVYLFFTLGQRDQAGGLDFEQAKDIEGGI